MIRDNDFEIDFNLLLRNPADHRKYLSLVWVYQRTENEAWELTQMQIMYLPETHERDHW